MRFTERELTTILYALRQVEDELTHDPALVAGAVHFIDIEPLDVVEIDDLCERLNCDPEPLLDDKDALVVCHMNSGHGREPHLPNHNCIDPRRA